MKITLTDASSRVTDEVTFLRLCISLYDFTATLALTIPDVLVTVWVKRKSRRNINKESFHHRLS